MEKSSSFNTRTNTHMLLSMNSFFYLRKGQKHNKQVVDWFSISWSYFQLNFSAFLVPVHIINATNTELTSD